MMKTSRTPVRCILFGSPAVPPGWASFPGATIPLPMGAKNEHGGRSSRRCKRKVTLNIDTTEIELAARDEAARLRKETVATAARTSVKLTAMQKMAELRKSLSRAASKAEEKVQECTTELLAAKASLDKVQNVVKGPMKTYSDMRRARATKRAARKEAKAAVAAARQEVAAATQRAKTLNEKAAAAAVKSDLAAGAFYDEDQRLLAIDRKSRKADRHAVWVSEAVLRGVEDLSRADRAGEGGGFAELLAAGGVLNKIDSANLPERTGARKRARR